MFETKKLMLKTHLQKYTLFLMQSKMISKKEARVRVMHKARTDF